MRADRRPNGPPLAYVFERFPSFSQTFCFREVAALRRAGWAMPVFVLRAPENEPPQEFPENVLTDRILVPRDVRAELTGGSLIERGRRHWLLKRRRLDLIPDKRRVFEALWIGPQLRERGIRHVHCHFAGMAARTACWIKRLYGVRFSFTAHANDIFLGAEENTELPLEVLMREADAVVTVSDYSVRILQERFPACSGKVRRVYNGLDFSVFDPDETSSPNAVQRLLAVGRYIEKKGFADLVDACARLERGSIRCRIVGEGPLGGELQKRVSELGLSGSVEIVGPRTESEVRAELRACDVFVLPCTVDRNGDRDNLPTVIMEAMAARKAVVSTPVAGVPEMLENGRTGLLVPERDPAALSEAIRHLTVNPAVAAAMGREGRLRGERLFSSTATTAALQDMFLEMPWMN